MDSLRYISFVTAGVVSLFATSSTNFRLDSYGVGSGGTSNSSSSTYKLNGISGQSGASNSAGGTYKVGTGMIPTQQANVPAAPTVTNPANYYNKLHIVIDNGSNPSDATFAIAISTDSFATTQYVQNDTTIGSALGSEDYQTYSAWGGASGFDVIGLTPNTTYYVKVKAEHGDFTESAYSAVASASTISPSLTFDIDVASTDTETAPPYATNFGTLLAGTVANSPERIWIDLETNGTSGGTVFIASANTGLHSLATSYTISALTGDLSSLSEGFGAQSQSATQTSGGPLSAQSPYTGASHNVGITDTTLRQIYVSANPITAGRASLLLKAKSKTDTPAAIDYTDTLTLVAAASF